jgi:hypothetical protein
LSCHYTNLRQEFLVMKSVCNAGKSTDRRGLSIRHHRDHHLGNGMHDLRKARPRALPLVQANTPPRRDEKFFPILEVSLDRSCRHSGAFCRIVNCHLFVALFAQQMTRGLQKL